jgi:cytochrome c-type biogenesis protein CcmH/NrfG
MLLEMNRPALAHAQFGETLKRTPGRPMVIYGLARCAQAQGDNQAAARHYADFLRVWRNADPGRPEIGIAQRFLATLRPRRTESTPSSPATRPPMRPARWVG